jgi:hypothetical protein
MGCVKTTMRQISGGSRRFSTTLGRRETVLGAKSVGTVSSYSRSALASDALRWKSTMASLSDSDDDEEDSNRSRGHAEGVKARMALSHDEAWMVNLGRGDNDAWLLGPRDEDEWFTGLKPAICPGK